MSSFTGTEACSMRFRGGRAYGIAARPRPDRFFNRLVWLAGAVSTLCASPCLAQDGAAGDDGDIVVTANKREQNLSDVGMTVSVLQGDALKARQINNLADIAAAVPGLTYTNSAENTPVYTLRGVSFYETSVGAYPAVSVYVDEVNLPFSALANHIAYDLERVEVLKGPQGTLFGANSTGGAVNFIAAKPTSNFAAAASLSVGRFRQVIGEGYVSGPLSENLRARVALRIEQGAAWQRSLTRPDGPDGRNGSLDNVMGRVLLDYEPSDRVRIQASLSAWRDHSDPQAVQFVGFQNLLPLSPQERNYLGRYAPEDARAADWTPGLLYARNREYVATLRSDIELADDLTLTTLTSYIDFRQRMGNDLDGLPIKVGDHAPNNADVSSFAQEVRLGNGGGGALRWLVGANYDHSNVDQRILYDYSSTASGFRNGISFNYLYGRQRLENYAFFTNLEYDVGSALTLKGGLRYSNNRADGRNCVYDPTGRQDNSGGFFYRVIYRGRFGPYPAGACYSANNLGTTINGVAPGDPGEFAGTLHQDSISWRAGVDWKPADGLLIYGNVSKGYKAGSFPVASGSAWISYQAVTQESVLAFEGGVKASLFDRLLQLDVAAFHYDYRDKQLRAKVVDPVFGALDALQNIPKSSVIGFELQSTFRPARGLRIAGSYIYLDAQVDQFVGINGVGQAGDFAGTPIPFTSKHQFNFDAEYRFPVASGVEVFVGGNVNYRSSIITVVGGSTNPAQATPATFLHSGVDGYTLVDLRAGVELNDRVRAWVWGKNVFDKYYWTNAFLSSDTTGRYAGMPATYGVTVGYTFR